GATAHQTFKITEETDFQCRLAAVGRWQQYAHHPGQGQQGEDPRPGELKHVCESRFQPLGSDRKWPCRPVCIPVCTRLRPAPSSASGRQPGNGYPGTPAICGRSACGFGCRGSDCGTDV